MERYDEMILDVRNNDAAPEPSDVLDTYLTSREKPDCLTQLSRDRDQT